MQQTKTQPKRRWWLWGGAALVIVVVGGIAGAALVFDMRVAINPGAQFAEARARWQAANVDSYTLFVEVQAPFQTSGVYELTVHDGELTDAVVYNPPTFRFDPDAPAFDVPVSQGAPYTLEALFDRAARLQQDFAPLHIYTAGTSHVRYDEDDGYVTDLVDNTCGWLTLAEECVTRIRVIRFDPLSTSSLQFPHDRTIVMGQNHCIYRAEVCH